MPGHWRSHPELADQRRADPLPPRFELAAPAPGAAPLDHVRRHLLPGRRVARRRLPRRPGGLLLPPQLRRHRALPPRRRPRAGRRGDVQPRARHPRPAQHHRAVPALRGRRPALEPGRAVAAGARLRHRAGQARPAARAVPRRRRDPRPPAPGRPPRQRHRPHRAPAHDRRRRRSSARPSTRWPPAPTRSSGRSTSTGPGCGGRGRSATSRSPTSASSCSSTATVSDRRSRRTGLREVAWNDWVCSINGERLFLKGANLLPTRPGLADASPADVRRDVELAVEAGLDALRVQAHIADHELYRAADELGVLLLQDFPLQWGYARQIRREAVRQAREAVNALGHHPSIVQWCAHDEPVRRRPAGRGGRDAAGAPAPVRVAAAADVEQVDPRPLAQAGVRAGRPDPPDGRPRRGRCRTCPSSTAPTPTCGSAGTTARSASWPSSPASCPASSASSASSAPSRCRPSADALRRHVALAGARLGRSCASTTASRST